MPRHCLALLSVWDLAIDGRRTCHQSPVSLNHPGIFAVTIQKLEDLKLMPEERVKISPRFRTGIPKISVPQKFSIFHNKSTLHPIASIFFLIFFGKHRGRKIKSQNPRKLTNSWTWKFIPSMTVTLPRALEVCGVTRSIRCPFKCVPYKSKLHCTMKSHITTFLYPTIPQLCHTLHWSWKERSARLPRNALRVREQRTKDAGRTFPP